MPNIGRPTRDAEIRPQAIASCGCTRTRTGERPPRLRSSGAESLTGRTKERRNTMSETDLRKRNGLPLAKQPAAPGSPWRARLFGGWLPLIAFYDPPCHRDGSPWNGRDDPGFRVTTLVLGWLGSGVSFTLGGVRPADPRAADAAGSKTAIAALDERIESARTQDGSSN